MSKISRDRASNKESPSLPRIYVLVESNQMITKQTGNYGTCQSLEGLWRNKSTGWRQSSGRCYLSAQSKKFSLGRRWHPGRPLKKIKRVRHAGIKTNSSPGRGKDKTQDLEAGVCWCVLGAKRRPVWLEPQEMRASANRRPVPVELCKPL